MRSALSLNATKILASIALVGGAAGVAGLGTFGGFTSTTTANESVATGRVELGLTQHGTAGTTVAASGLVPGDAVHRSVSLTRNAGTQSFGSVSLTTTAGSANVLTSDATNGLQLTVDNCSVAWTVEADNSLSCSGTQSSVVASRAVIGGPLDLGPATTALNAAGATAYLRLKLALPAVAGNAFQGLSNAITFTFDATQPSAGNR